MTPNVGIVEPFGRKSITISVVFQEAGARNVIIRELFLNDESTFEDLKVKVTGVGCNLGICPSMDRSSELDFGSLFV